MIERQEKSALQNPKSSVASASSASWIVHLIDKGCETVTVAGAIAWVSVVAVVAICAIAFVVYVMTTG
jgi:hypothetical protein